MMDGSISYPLVATDCSKFAQIVVELPTQL